MISSVAPNRSSAFYAYLITKIKNRKLKIILKEFTKIFIHISGPTESGCSIEDLDLTGRSKNFQFLVSQLRPFLGINFYLYM